MVNIGKNFGKDIPTTLKPMTTVYAPKIEIPVENKAAAKSAPLKAGQGAKLDTSNLKFDPVDKNGDVVPYDNKPSTAKAAGKTYRPTDFQVSSQTERKSLLECIVDEIVPDWLMDILDYCVDGINREGNRNHDQPG